MNRKKRPKKVSVSNGISRDVIMYFFSKNECPNCKVDYSGDELFCQRCSEASHETLSYGASSLYIDNIKEMLLHKNNGVDEVIRFSNKNNYRPDLFLLKIMSSMEEPVLLDAKEIMKLIEGVEEWNSKNETLVFMN